MRPIDFGHLQAALASTRGWLELLVTLLCVLLAWAIDRRLDKVRERRNVYAHVPRSVVRIAFPLFAVALTYVASFAWRRYAGATFFLNIATPILIALAIIRILVYGLRRVFPSQAWLPASEVAIGTTIWGLAILYFLGVLPEMAVALDAVVIPLGKSQISVLTIFTGIVVVLATVVVTLWISGLIEHRLALATQLDANLRVVLSKAISAVLIVVGILIANYIAGFVILLDRSIRLGDLITVDNRMGVVTKVSSRYVVVRSGDGIEVIVPNETLVTTTVLNHTYTTSEVRMVLTVQVAYGTDVDRALKLLESIALADPRVLREARAPAAALQALGDNGITLELGVWVGDPHIQGNLRSTLYRAVLKQFADNGVAIPSPQRDVRVIGPLAIAGAALSDRTTATPAPGKPA